jgi:hypothetical protein
VRTLRRSLISCALALGSAAHAGADSGVLVYFLDKNYRPTVRLDRLAQPAVALRGILAMYALQNGGGCESRGASGLIQCKLTTSLGLGDQCSSQHLAVVRELFAAGMPQMSGFGAHLYSSVPQEGVLESLCYGQLDSASRQRTWTAIRFKVVGQSVSVEAHGAWRSPYGEGPFGFQTEYNIANGTVSVVSHRELSTRRGQR